MNASKRENEMRNKSFILTSTFGHKFEFSRRKITKTSMPSTLKLNIKCKNNIPCFHFQREDFLALSICMEISLLFDVKKSNIKAIISHCHCVLRECIILKSLSLPVFFLFPLILPSFIPQKHILETFNDL